MENLRLRVMLMAFGVALSWMWTWGDFLWAQEPVYDIVIRGGRIVDGTGNPWFKGDVGIQGGRITAVGSISNGARRVIDAEGLVVAPGFIDLHTHSDLPLLRNGNAESKIRQGVTLDVLGEVGSVGPRDGLDNEDRGGGKSSIGPPSPAILIGSRSKESPSISFPTLLQIRCGEWSWGTTQEPPPQLSWSG